MNRSGRTMGWEPLEKAPRREFKPHRTYLLETREQEIITHRSIMATSDALWFWAGPNRSYRVDRADTRKAHVDGGESGVVACTVLTRR